MRRRTEDGATLHALAECGHDLQERLTCHQAWIAADRPATAHKYAEVRNKVSIRLGGAVNEAWTLPPVVAPAEMNLGTWGPAQECAPFITDLQHHIERRFGLRWLRRSGR